MGSYKHIGKIVVWEAQLFLRSPSIRPMTFRKMKSPPSKCDFVNFAWRSVRFTRDYRVAKTLTRRRSISRQRLRNEIKRRKTSIRKKLRKQAGEKKGWRKRETRSRLEREDCCCPIGCKSTSIVKTDANLRHSWTEDDYKKREREKIEANTTKEKGNEPRAKKNPINLYPCHSLFSCYPIPNPV